MRTLRKGKIVQIPGKGKPRPYGKNTPYPSTSRLSSSLTVYFHISYTLKLSSDFHEMQRYTFFLFQELKELIGVEGVISYQKNLIKIVVQTNTKAVHF